jgi:hypothetical protein
LSLTRIGFRIEIDSVVIREIVGVDTEDTSKQQVVLGCDVRAAGRDYFENLSIGKAAEWLKLQSDAVRDQYATEGEGAFKLIYRFSVLEEQRPAVIGLKKKAKLTEELITYLRRTGVLEIKDEVTLAPSAKLEAFGWLYTILLALVAVIVLGIQPDHPRSLGLAMAQLVAGLSYLAIAGLCCYTFVIPNRIGRTALKHLLAQKANC